MNKIYVRWIVISLLLLQANLVFASSSTTARIMFLRGVVTATDEITQAPRILRKNSRVEAGDLLETGPKGLIKIMYPDSSMIFLKSSSKLKLQAISYDKDNAKDDEIVVDMLKGGLRAFSGAIGKRNPEKIRYNTTVSTIGVRGTAIRLEEQGDDEWSVVFDIGSGYASNDAGVVDIDLDNALTVSSTQAIGKPVKVEQDSDDPAQRARRMATMENDQIQITVKSLCDALDESDVMLLLSMQAQLPDSAKDSMSATVEVLSSCLPSETVSGSLSLATAIKPEISDELFRLSIVGGLDVAVAMEAIMTGLLNSHPQMYEKILPIALKAGLSKEQAFEIISGTSAVCL